MGEHSLWISATDGRLRLHFETSSTDNLNPDQSVTLLLNTQAISKSYGATALFRNISLSINEGDRLGLIGPNGSGKSTFMEILAQRREPDAGEVVMRKGTRLAFLAQDSQFAPGETVRTVSGVGQHRGVRRQDEEPSANQR